VKKACPKNHQLSDAKGPPAGLFQIVQVYLRGTRKEGKMGGSKPVILHETGYEEGWDDERHGRVKWRTLFSNGRTPTDSLTVGVAEIRFGDELKAHRHETAEVYYFLAGEGIVTIDGVENPVRANSAAYIPGNAAHGIRNTGQCDLRFFYVFAVNSFGDVEYAFPE
jgi:mannose-6-phosphate isomerase-like protein (cupin superfamily)